MQQKAELLACNVEASTSRAEQNGDNPSQEKYNPIQFDNVKGELHQTHVSFYSLILHFCCLMHLLGHCILGN